MAKDDDDHNTIEGFRKVLAALANRPLRDLRSGARVEADNVWTSLLAKCDELHGRSPSIEPFDQDHEGGIYLDSARDAESVFIRLALSPATPLSVVEQARTEFFDGVIRWVGYVTKKWPSAAVYRRQQRQHAETWGR